MTPEKRKRGRPPEPLTPLQEADIDMARQLRPWWGWEGGAHCGRAAFELALSLGRIYKFTRSKPEMMFFRNAFRSYCNLWRGREMGENWEVPDADSLASMLPSAESLMAAFQQLGLTDPADMVLRLIHNQTFSFVMPKRKTREGKSVPIRVVLGLGPGDDPRGYGRKRIPVRYADGVEQRDRLACCLIELDLCSQLVALRMDKMGEDLVTAKLRHELLVLYHLNMALWGVMGVQPGSYCWVPEFLEIHKELQETSSDGPLPSDVKVERAVYAFIAFLRLRREAGGAADLPSVLYCEDPDCEEPMFLWKGSSRTLRKGQRGKPSPPCLCEKHDPEAHRVWRRKRAAMLKRGLPKVEVPGAELPVIGFPDLVLPLRVIPGSPFSHARP